VDRFTHKRLRVEATVRAQERASLRKQAHPNFTVAQIPVH
jgi:hypothetical protein